MSKDCAASLSKVSSHNVLRFSFRSQPINTLQHNLRSRYCHLHLLIPLYCTLHQSFCCQLHFTNTTLSHSTPHQSFYPYVLQMSFAFIDDIFTLVDLLKNCGNIIDLEDDANGYILVNDEGTADTTCKMTIRCSKENLITTRFLVS